MGTTHYFTRVVRADLLIKEHDITQRCQDIKPNLSTALSGFPGMVSNYGKDKPFADVDTCTGRLITLPRTGGLRCDSTWMEKVVVPFIVYVLSPYLCFYLYV